MSAFSIGEKPFIEDFGLPYRGSSFNNTSNGGAAALNLNNPRTNSNNNISFRSALPLLTRSPAHKWTGPVRLG